MVRVNMLVIASIATMIIRRIETHWLVSGSEEKTALIMAPEAKESWIHRAWSNPHVKSGKNSVLGSHFVAATAEFVGTFFFLWLGYGGQLMALTQAAAPAGTGGGASSETVVFISLIYSFSLLVNAWAFYRISGGLFNPAVSLGLSLAGKLPWARTAFLIPAQLLASMCAGGLAAAMFNDEIVSVNTLLSAETSTAKGLFIEMFMTAELVFVILMLAAEKSKDTFLAPVGIGLALFICELTALYYRFVKWAHYEEVNPGQDSAGPPENADAENV
ncbi:hypothetical protein LA080_006401 [Diaporthe eres]|nr:hypothetical protein LA080_006401 [Diaporthe eres]